MSLKTVNQRWQTYLRTQSLNDFDAYLKQFNEHYKTVEFDDIGIDLTRLCDGFLQSISAQLCILAEVHTLSETELQRVLLILDCLKLIARNRKNVALIASLSFCKKLYEMTLFILRERGNQSRIQVVKSFIDFLERLYDPYFIWKQRLESNWQGQGGEHEPALVDGIVISFIFEVFNRHGVDFDLRYELIHLLGCIISGSQKNAMLAICQPVLDVLHGALTADDLFVLKTPCRLRSNIFTCFVWIIHTLHSANPDERQIEIREVVDKYVKVMEHLSTDVSYRTHKPELIIPLFSTLEKMVRNQKDSEGLRASFISVDIFRRLLNLIICLETDDMTSLAQLAVSFVDCLKELLYRSPAGKSNFSETVGYTQLLQCLKRLGSPHASLVKKLLDMTVENDYVGDGCQRIANASIILLLIDWLPELKDELLQEDLAMDLLRLCTTVEKNRMTCCESLVILSAIKALENPLLYNTSFKIAGKLFRLIEMLGVLSMSAAELKKLVSLLMFKPANNQATFRARVLQTLSYITDKQKSNKPFCHFSLPTANSAIEIPADITPKLLKSGFTFHAWIRVDSSPSYNGFRRVIYSFQAKNGGFEAFISADGYLHVAILVLYDHYYVFEVSNPKLADGEWHMIDVVHLPKWRITVYLDGKMCKSCHMTSFDPDDRVTYRVGGPVTTPHLQSHYFHPNSSTSGPISQGIFKIVGILSRNKRADDDVIKIGCGFEHEQFGVPVGMHGHLGTICLFKQIIQEKHIRRIYDKGADCMEVFRDDPELSNMLPDVLFHYNARMCADKLCIDLSGNAAGNDGRIIEGHTCSSYYAKDMIQCIGGLQVLIPLLEKVRSFDEPAAADFTVDELFTPDSPSFPGVNSVACFFHTLRCFMENSAVNQDYMLRTNSFAIIGCLLQQLDSRYIDVQTFLAVQRLALDFKGNTALSHSLLQHLMLDFRIWTNSLTEVRVAQAQYMLSEAKDDKVYFRKHFNVQFILDNIRQFYCDYADNSTDDIKQIRSDLFHLIRIYVGNNIQKEELMAILRFIHTVDDYRVVEEALQVLIALMKNSGDQIYLKMFEADAAILLFDLIIKKHPRGNTDPPKVVPLYVMETIIEIFVMMITTDKILEPHKRSIRMEDFGISGLVRLMEPLKPGEDNLCLGVLDLVMLPVNASREIHCANLLDVISLSYATSNNTKLTISLKVLELINVKPSCISGMVSVIGWQDSIACLLRKPSGKEELPRSDSPSFTLDSVPGHDFTLVNLMEFTDDDPEQLNGESDTDSVVSSEHSLLNSTPTSFRSQAVNTGPSSTNVSSSHSAIFDTSALANQMASSDETGDCLPATSHACSPECVDCDVLSSLKDTVLQIHSKLIWKGLEVAKPMKDVWKERFKVIYSVRSAKQQLLVNRTVYERQLLESLLEICCQEVQDTAPADANGTNNGNQLIRLVRDFTISCIRAKDDNCFSLKILEQLMKLLQKMAVWHQETAWEELGFIGLHIILFYSCSNSLELCSLASSKINLLIREEAVKNESEINYIVYQLNERLSMALTDPNGYETYAFLLEIMRPILTKYSQQPEHRIYLPNLPLLSGNPRLLEDFRIYFKENEWKNYMRKVVEIQRQDHERTLKGFDSLMMNEWFEVESSYNEEIHQRLRKNGDSQLRFKETVCMKAKDLSADKERFSGRRKRLNHSNMLVLQAWKSKMEFFTGVRGAWFDGNVEKQHWMISTHENFNRMRIKLIPNDRFDKHEDASYARDHSDPIPQVLPDDMKLGAPSFRETEDEDLDLPVQEPDVPQTAAINSAADKKEELVYKADCELILMMDPIPGKLKITNKNFYFIDNQTDKIGADFHFSLTMLRDVHCRLRNLQRTALEFFLHDQTNYLLNFKLKDARKSVLQHINRLKRGDSKFRIYGVSRKVSQVLKDSDLTNKWVRREISNFDYLMQLNTIAGRTYNDWSQYPVFPWVVADYTSSVLNLDDPSTFRDLSKPAGALNPSKEEELRNKYHEFDDPGGMAPFHHGSHYSSTGGVVLHFLVRMEPFTSKHIELQSGRFDVADRLFFSLAASYQSLLTRADDCKELTPDFFCQPEFLVNMNEFDLGNRQAEAGSGQVPVGDVVLPKWAKTPDEFIWLHRQALESDFVSKNLHNWIDLIFGYKQRGEEAVKACNVFHAYTYEGAYDMEKMDERSRQIAEKFINEFGQTPVQLLTNKHPQRKTEEECLEQHIKENKPVSLLPYLKSLRFYKADICGNPQAGKVILVCVPPGQTRFATGAPHDTMVTISDRGVVGLHKWLPYDSQISNKFDFIKDHDVESLKDRKMLKGPFMPGIAIDHKLFAVSHDAEYIYSCGYWDYSLRVYCPRRDTTKFVSAHNGVVTCLSLDSAGEHLVTGSADMTCKIWAVSKQDVGERPLQCLYGHDAEVACVAISTEYDMVVSGAKDGTVNIYTVRKGLFIQTLEMSKLSGNIQSITVNDIVLSYLGHIIVYTNQREGNSNKILKQLELFTLNGRRLCQQKTDDNITHMITVAEYLIYGTKEGYLNICEIFNFQKVNRKKLHEPISCVHMTYTASSNKYTHILAGLEGSPSSMIVAVRDCEPQMRRTLLSLNSQPTLQQI